MERLLLLALLSLSAFPSMAQYKGPAVETCRAYAEREIRRDTPALQALVFDDDASRNLERYARKLGSQPVSSILTGNGAIVYQQGPAVELSFVCLLASERQAVFFHWIPRRDAPALAQCRRRGAAGALECLDALLQVAEQDLTMLYAKHYTDARDADAKAGDEAASNTFRKSAETWRAYRDAECARREGAEVQKACVVELTRRRARDLR
jgi:uncharacterized protein YecT (DUF1311 family)